MFAVPAPPLAVNRKLNRQRIAADLAHDIRLWPRRTLRAQHDNNAPPQLRAALLGLIQLGETSVKRLRPC